MHRIEVRLKEHLPDARGMALARDIHDLGINSVASARVVDIYWLDAHLTDKQLELLLSNLQHPSLNIKKMQDPREIWEGRVTESYRFTFQIQGDDYILRRVGTHDILKNP